MSPELLDSSGVGSSRLDAAAIAARRKMFRLIAMLAGGACCVAVAGVLMWIMLRAEEPNAELAPLRPVRQIAAKILPIAEPAPEPVAVPEPEPVAPTPPSEEIMSLVENLTVSAVYRGAQPRAIIAGRKYFPGDTVAPGVILHEITEAYLHFRDEAENVYPRRF